jgi:16S rRNA (uracil1498-N3)-methyltransferase
LSVRLSRIHVPGPLRAGEALTLPDASAHYAARVLRLRPGDAVVLFDGGGGEYAATVDSVGRRAVRLQIGEHLVLERESPTRLSLALGISRGERMDYAVQKAVELGVQHIVPLVTERCAVRLDERRAENRCGHWRKVMISACEQCGRNRIPEIDPVTEYGSWLTRGREGLGLVFGPEADTPLARLAPKPDTPITALIGPEGGLSDHELERARRAGFTAVRLGPRVLRTETAAVAALVAIQVRWGDLG